MTFAKASMVLHRQSLYVEGTLFITSSDPHTVHSLYSECPSLRFIGACRPAYWSLYFLAINDLKLFPWCAAPELHPAFAVSPRIYTILEKIARCKKKKSRIVEVA